MDPKAEGKLNKLIIRISAVIFLLLGIGVLVVEYIFFVEDQRHSNVAALVVFITSLILYCVLIFIVIKNRHRIFNFGEDDIN